MTTISVIVPVYNDRDGLTATVHSLLEQEYPADGYEILVVDNGSTDDTQQVLIRYKKKFSCSFLYEIEKNPGAAIARNRIVRKSDSEIIAFIDDDVKVEKEWLSALVEAYRRWPNASAVGGKANLVFEGPCPYWVQAKERQRLSEIDLGNKMMLLSADQTLYSLNLSFRKKAFNQWGLFREDLDRKGDRLLNGGETELLKRFQKKGAKIYYDPAMSVNHYVFSSRLKKAWFLRRSYWSGRTRVRVSFYDDGVRPGFEIREIVQLGKSTGSFLYHLLRDGFESDAVYRSAEIICLLWGVVVEKVKLCFEKISQT